MVRRSPSNLRSNRMVISAAAAAADGDEDHLDGKGRKEGAEYEDELRVRYKQKPLLVHRPARFDRVEELNQYCRQRSWQHQERVLREQYLNVFAKFSDTSASSASPKPKSELQHHRGIDSASQDYGMQCVHTMDDVQGTLNNGWQVINLSIIDSGSPVHCTGDMSLFSDYNEAETDCYIYGAGGNEMKIHGYGSVWSEFFQMTDVVYVPSLNKPTIKKTIFSVSKLGELGYSVHFNGACCTVMDNRQTWSWTSWTWTNEIVGEARIVHGHYILSYLRIPKNRAPVSTSEQQPHTRSLWNTACSSWSIIAQRMSQRLSAHPHTVPI